MKLVFFAFLMALNLQAQELQDSALIDEIAALDTSYKSEWVNLLEKDSLQNSCSLKMIPFDSNQHELSYTDNYLAEIDGKEFYGTDGSLPTHKLHQIKITIEGKETELPNYALQQLFDYVKHCRPYYPSLFQSLNQPNVYYLNIGFSDGAGGYSVTWVIRNDQYVGRSIFIP
jgi:hypothetical protein